MATNLKRRWQLGKVRPGDGSPLPDYRLWHLFSRSVFFLELVDKGGRPLAYAVDVRPWADPKSRREHEAGGKSPAALYRDGVQVARSNLPATFPVEGGVVEVAASMAGLKRLRFVDDGGGELPLRPHPRSHEGRRARLARTRPRLSAGIGAVSLVTLLVALTLMLVQLAATLSEIPPVADNLGVFTSPVTLPVWGNVGLGLLAAFAGTERATRLRHHWLLDSAVS